MLGLLAFGARSGYELARLAERSVGYLWTPSRSQIYKVLPRLAQSGLADAREVEQDARPDKAVYTLTPAGRKALRSWIEEIEAAPAGGRVVFALKLFFCDFATPVTALAQLAAYRAFLEHSLKEYEQLEADDGDIDSAYAAHVLSHGIARARATITWIDATALAIETTGAAPPNSRRRIAELGL